MSMRVVVLGKSNIKQEVWFKADTRIQNYSAEKKTIFSGVFC